MTKQPLLPRPTDTEQRRCPNPPPTACFVEALLLEAQDPDPQFFRHLRRGVPLGVGVRLPRTPATFERKTSWKLRLRLLEDAARVAANYSSAAERPEVVSEQYLGDDASA